VLQSEELFTVRLVTYSLVVTFD